VIETVGAADLGELLGLMRAYCDFYGTSPEDEVLLALARALLADPSHEGLQLIAHDEHSAPVGFATILWSWDTTEGARIAIMHDLYVVPDARGTGLAERLIDACLEHARQRGASRLAWQTAPENLRAQALYDRLGGVREPWLSYTLSAERS
jgi:GNAT superfamily N-acetyltransferase